MSHTHHIAFESFWISAALIFAAGAYLRGWVRVRSLDRDSAAGWRAAGFALGLLFIWVATASSLATLDHDMLTAHMVQHLLLMTIAPPLILLSTPGKPLLHGVTQRWAQVIGRLFVSTRLRQLGRALAHPAVCWLGAAVTLVVWHIPAVFMLGLRSQMWHEIEQASFLATGLLFWWPVIPPSPSTLRWPESSILLYLFLATLPCDVLSGFLVFCDRVVYPDYRSPLPPFALSALQDQQCAGALMWTCVTIVFLIAGTIVTARLLSPESSQAPSIPQSASQGMVAPRTVGQSMEAV